MWRIVRKCTVILVLASSAWMAYPQDSAEALGDALIQGCGPPMAVRESARESQIEYYNEILTAFSEEPLGLVDCPDRESYRLLWLRTFHRPLLLRFQRVNNLSWVTIKQLSGQGGFNIGKLMPEKEVSLNDQQWTKVKALLSYVDFFNLETYDPSVVGADGAEWVLEGRCYFRYKMVVRWSPGQTAYRDACVQLLQLAGMNLAPDEIY